MQYRDVLEGVLLLMGQEDTSWAAMRSFLGRRSVKEDIVNFDARRWVASLPLSRAQNMLHFRSCGPCPCPGLGR